MAVIFIPPQNPTIVPKNNHNVRNAIYIFIYFIFIYRVYIYFYIYMLSKNSLFHTLFCVCSGLIGRSWAMVFISGGYNVKLYDNQPGQAAKAITEIRYGAAWIYSSVSLLSRDNKVQDKSLKMLS